MTLDDIDELIRKYLATGMTVLIILVGPGTGQDARPTDPEVITVQPESGESSGADDLEPDPPSGDPEAGDPEAGDPEAGEAEAGDAGSDDGADPEAGGPPREDHTGADGTDPEIETEGDDDVPGDRDGSGDDTTETGAASDTQGGDAGDRADTEPVDPSDTEAGTETGTGTGTLDPSDTGTVDPPDTDTDTASPDTDSPDTDPGAEADTSTEAGTDPGADRGSEDAGAGSEPQSGAGAGGETDPGAESDADSATDGADPGVGGGNSTDSEGTDSTGTTAAARHGWGSPNRVDQFSDGISSDWNVYEGPGHAGKGKRSRAAISVADGVLTITGDAAGTTGGMAWKPGQRYGRWEGRVRAPAADPSYNPVLLLWPDADDFPVGGEIDFMEMLDADRRKADMFVHYGQNNSQLHGQVEVDAQRWHNWAVEWTPEAITGYLDGEEWFRTTDPKVQPPGPMHLSVQLDWFPEGTSPEGASMQVDWVRQYPVDVEGGGPDGARSDDSTGEGTGQDTDEPGSSEEDTGEEDTGEEDTGEEDTEEQDTEEQDTEEARSIPNAIRRMFSWS